MRIGSKAVSVIAIVSFFAAAAPNALGQGGKYEIKVEQRKPQPTMSIKFEAAPDKLGETYGEVFGELFTYVMSNGGQMAGRPFGRYHEMTEEKFDVEAGVPMAKVLPAKGRIKPSQLPGGAVATTIHVGAYEELGAAHDALQTWAGEHGKEAAGGPWEEYLTDPSSEPDPTKYKTQVFLPIKDAKKAE